MPTDSGKQETTRIFLFYKKGLKTDGPSSSNNNCIQPWYEPHSER